MSGTRGKKLILNVVAQAADHAITEDYHYGDYGMGAAAGIGAVRSVVSSAGAAILGQQNVLTQSLISGVYNGCAVEYLREGEFGFDMRDAVAGAVMEGVSCYLSGSGSHLYDGDLTNTEDSVAEDFNGY